MFPACGGVPRVTQAHGPLASAAAPASLRQRRAANCAVGGMRRSTTRWESTGRRPVPKVSWGTPPDRVTGHASLVTADGTPSPTNPLVHGDMRSVAPPNSAQPSRIGSAPCIRRRHCIQNATTREGDPNDMAQITQSIQMPLHRGERSRPGRGRARGCDWVNLPSRQDRRIETPGPKTRSEDKSRGGSGPPTAQAARTSRRRAQPTRRGEAREQAHERVGKPSPRTETSNGSRQDHRRERPRDRTALRASPTPRSRPQDRQYHTAEPHHEQTRSPVRTAPPNRTTPQAKPTPPSRPHHERDATRARPARARPHHKARPRHEQDPHHEQNRSRA